MVPDELRQVDIVKLIKKELNYLKIIVDQKSEGKCLYDKLRLFKYAKYVKNDLEIKLSTLPSLQPAPLGIFCEFFIDLFNIEDSKNIYQFSHLFNFIIHHY